MVCCHHIAVGKSLLRLAVERKQYSNQNKNDAGAADCDTMCHVSSMRHVYCVLCTVD
jgi:hypothetical protein